MPSSVVSKLFCQQVRSLTAGEAWHAAKQLVAEGAVNLTSYQSDPQLGCVALQGHITALNANAASFPHLGPSPAPAAGQPCHAVQLCLDSSTGCILDACSSCCAGGFQCVLGSFCPCVAALLLCVAKQARLPEEGCLQPLVRST